jgi:hypothetical protein
VLGTNPWFKKMRVIGEKDKYGQVLKTPVSYIESGGFVFLMRLLISVY